MDMCPRCGRPMTEDHRNCASDIVTHFVHPPIPVRAFDWIAYFDGEEESGPYGYGRTEADAIAELREHDDERRPLDKCPSCSRTDFNQPFACHKGGCPMGGDL